MQNTDHNAVSVYVCVLTDGLIVGYQYSNTLRLLMTASPSSQSLQVAVLSFIIDVALISLHHG